MDRWMDRWMDRRTYRQVILLDPPWGRGPKTFFKKYLFQAQLDKDFESHAEIQRNLMIQFHEMPGQTMRQTDPFL